MKNTTLRFVLLSLTLTLCVLAQNPQLAQAATCPLLTCEAFLAHCNVEGCGGQTLTPNGTCTLNGTTHNQYEGKCRCFSAPCYE